MRNNPVIRVCTSLNFSCFQIAFFILVIVVSESTRLLYKLCVAGENNHWSQLLRNKPNVPLRSFSSFFHRFVVIFLLTKHLGRNDGGETEGWGEDAIKAVCEMLGDNI